MLELLILVLLILANGVLAMAEIAVVSASKARLQQQAETGNTRASTALELATSPNHFLATVQVGISLVAILSGAFGGAQFSDEMAAILEEIPVLSRYSESVGLGLVVVLITYASLVFGELVPKRIGLSNSSAVAMLIAGPMKRLSLLAAPIVRLLSLSTSAVLRVLRVQVEEESPVNEDELRLLVAEGTRAGIFEPNEEKMLSQVMHLDTHRVVELMTPRPRMIWLDIEQDIDTLNQQMRDSGFSYFPVYRSRPENLLGMVSAKQIWGKLVLNEPLDWESIMHELLFVPEQTTALQLLDIFRENRKREALVIDEFGNIQGLISLTDILQAIVGDVLPLRKRKTQPTRREDGSYLVDGIMKTDDLEDLLDIGELPMLDKDDSQTVGGFLMARLQRIPLEGDIVEIDGLRLEVVDMDGNRVDKVLVQHN
jgi:putative hemolysin